MKSTVINILKPYCSIMRFLKKNQPWGTFEKKAKHIIYPPVNQHRHIKSPCFLVNTVKMVDFPWLCLPECTISSKLLVAKAKTEAESFKKWTCKGDTFCWKLYRSFFCRYFCEQGLFFKIRGRGENRMNISQFYIICITNRTWSNLLQFFFRKS